MRESSVQDKQLRRARQWLNTRPDILLAIAKRYTTNPILSPASPSEAPPTLRLSVPPSSPTLDVLRISITTRPRGVEVDIPLRPRPTSTKEVKSVVKRMGKEAFGNFEIPPYPQVKSFIPPLAQLTFGPVIGLSLLLFLLLAPADHALANQGRALVFKYIGAWVIPAATWFAAACHLVIEPAILLRKLYRHQVPFVPSTLYLLTVFAIGYGGIDALNRAAIQERLNLLHPKSSDSKKSQ